MLLSKVFLAAACVATANAMQEPVANKWCTLPTRKGDLTENYAGWGVVTRFDTDLEACAKQVRDTTATKVIPACQYGKCPNRKYDDGFYISRRGDDTFSFVSAGYRTFHSEKCAQTYIARKRTCRDGLRSDIPVEGKETEITEVTLGKPKISYLCFNGDRPNCGKREFKGRIKFTGNYECYECFGWQVAYKKRDKHMFCRPECAVEFMQQAQKKAAEKEAAKKEAAKKEAQNVSEGYRQFHSKECAQTYLDRERTCRDGMRSDIPVEGKETEITEVTLGKPQISYLCFNGDRRNCCKREFKGRIIKGKYGKPKYECFGWRVAYKKRSD